MHEELEWGMKELAKKEGIVKGSVRKKERRGRNETENNEEK